MFSDSDYIVNRCECKCFQIMVRNEACLTAKASSGIDQDQCRQSVMHDADRHNITLFVENSEECKEENIGTIHQDQGVESKAEHNNAAMISEYVESSGKEFGELISTSTVKVENVMSLCENVEDWKMVRQRYT